MEENSTNEIYQWKMKILFLQKLGERFPEIFTEIKKKVLPAYKIAFSNYSKIISFDELQDALDEHEYYSSELAKLEKEFPKEELKIACLPETYEFAQTFVIWFDSWKFKAEWLADHLLTLLHFWNKDATKMPTLLHCFLLSNGGYSSITSAAFWLADDKDFIFQFPAWQPNQINQNDYQNNIKRKFEEQLKAYLKSQKENSCIDFIEPPITYHNKTHMEWFIEYKFTKKSYKKVSEHFQLKNNQVSRQAIAKAVQSISKIIQIPL